MNTAQIEFKPNDTDVIIACQHCLVCSITISAEEATALTAGQQMVEICPACGNTVYLTEADIK